MVRSCVAVALLGGVSALRAGPKPARADLESYSFDDFVRDFGREYARGSAEYAARAGHFEASLAQIRAQNARADRMWTAGVQDFMDWTEEEKDGLNGYRPAAVGRRPVAMAALQTAARSAELFGLASGGLDDDESGPQVRNQGRCGSCWAVSSAEAVEARLQKMGADVQVSPQALVDCAPNPQHCGGTGGCHGATGDVAYGFMRDHGVPLESELPYDGQTDACPVDLDGAWPTQHRVRVDSWQHLESNKAAPLMEALVSEGPAVVSVDAMSWHNYESGIFDGCDRDATLGHAVLAKGYGEEAGRKYWRIQNSWSTRWGERGHIRLLRQEDGGDSFCGTDHDPSKGEACDGGPSEVRVCGTCGVLYDSVYPQGVRLEHGGDDGGAAAAPTTTAPPKPWEPSAADRLAADAFTPWTPDAAPAAATAPAVSAAPAEVSAAVAAAETWVPEAPSAAAPAAQDASSAISTANPATAADEAAPSGESLRAMNEWNKIPDATPAPTTTAAAAAGAALDAPADYNAWRPTPISNEADKKAKASWIYEEKSLESFSLLDLGRHGAK